jgi:hypothetical protein
MRWVVLMGPLQKQNAHHVEEQTMTKEKKRKIIKYMIIAGWIVILLLGIILINRNDVEVLEDEKVDYLSTLNDNSEYNFSIQASIEKSYSPLYTCIPDRVPQYLTDLAKSIDSSLTRIDGPEFVRWQNEEGEDILAYNIDSTVLNVYLMKYPKTISFASIQEFLSEYIDTEIEYGEINEQGEGNTKIYTANRMVGENELVTGFGKSDYYLVEDGYLKNARILLAEISEEKFVVPLVNNLDALEKYVNNSIYPKEVVVNTSEIIEATPENYEDVDVEFDYQSCLINSIVPKLYFTSCNQNYIYYVYHIEGVCDVTYEKSLNSVTYQGFINAIDPEYVKSSE